MTATIEAKTDLIRSLNDAFRRTFVGGLVLITPGIEALPVSVRGTLLLKVRQFTAFTEDNDPYGEHDFGAIEEADLRCFWKIEYFDSDMEAGSPDPTDPDVTTRVLTIMLAEEY